MNAAPYSSYSVQACYVLAAVKPTYKDMLCASQTLQYVGQLPMSYVRQRWSIASA